MMDATVDAALDRLISKRASQDRRPDPDEWEELWKESVRRYEARRRSELDAAWHEYHLAAAGRLRTTLEALACHHEAEAERYSPKARSSA